MQPPISEDTKVKMVDNVLTAMCLLRLESRLSTRKNSG